MLKKVPIKDIVKDIDTSKLGMVSEEVLFGILQCDFLKEKQIVNYSDEYYGDGCGTSTWRWYSEEQTSYRHYFCDYNCFLSFPVTYIEGKIENETVIIWNDKSDNTLKITSKCKEVCSILIDYIESMTSDIIKIHRIEPYCSEYLEFVKLLKGIILFDMKNMLNHINLAYIFNGIPKRNISYNKEEEWYKIAVKRDEKIEVWKNLAREKNLNELSWQIMNAVREQICYDNRFNKYLDDKDNIMFDFLIERNRKLYEQGELDNFILLDKNDKKYMPSWIFALYSDIVCND